MLGLLYAVLIIVEYEKMIDLFKHKIEMSLVSLG